MHIYNDSTVNNPGESFVTSDGCAMEAVGGNFAMETMLKRRRNY